jgi:hypothetical protein
MKLSHTLAAAAAAFALAAGAAQAAGAIGKTSKLNLCHATGGTVLKVVRGTNTPVTVNQGVVINVPAQGALTHVQQHGDIPLGAGVLRSGAKCLAVAGTGDVIDEAGQVLQQAKPFLQQLIGQITGADLQELKTALQTLLNKLA